MLARQAVFLVGGRGTRLGALTAQTPKPLLEVAGTPFLDYLIRNVARYGIRNVLLLAGYLGDTVERRYRDFGRAHNIEIECVIELHEAGTAGALHFARDHLHETFLLFNGDTFFDINILDLALLPAPQDWLAKVALRRIEDASRYGVVTMRGNQICTMAERGTFGEGLINGGIYLLRRAIVDKVREIPCSLEADIFPDLAAKGQVFGRGYDGFFLDIGIPSDFTRAQTIIPRHMHRPAVFFDRDGILNEDLGYVHRPADFVWRPGAIDAIKLLNDSGYYTFVVTNQAGVARGLYSEAVVQDLHHWMAGELGLRGAHIDEFYYCPHHPEGTQSGYGVVCDCRKPGPGMLLSALAKWPIDHKGSFMIGDKPWDVEAAEAAGIRGVLSGGGNLRDEIAKQIMPRPVLVRQ